jgi:hypothetical protein
VNPAQRKLDLEPRSPGKLHMHSQLVQVESRSTGSSGNRGVKMDVIWVNEGFSRAYRVMRWIPVVSFDLLHR